MNTKQNGAALVEFALILPMMLLLTVITTEFGRAMYQYNTVTKSVRDAVRYLSIQPPADATSIGEARNLIVYGNITGTGPALARGLTLSMVSTPVWQTAGTSPVINTVTVTVTGYTFTPMVASVLGVGLFGNSGTIAFAPITATMRSAI